MVDVSPYLKWTPTWSSAAGDDESLLDEAPDDAEGVVERTVSLLDHQLVGAADHDGDGGTLNEDERLN